MLALNPRPVLASATAIAIPEALESVPAGFPSPAQDYFDHDLDPTALLISDPGSTSILIAAGSEMVAAGIFDGDRLVIARGEAPQDGQVVVAFLGGDLAIRRLRLKPSGHVLLAAEGDVHDDVEVPALADLHVWGVVTWVLHQLTPVAAQLPAQSDRLALDLAALLIPHPVSTFILRAAGHSMTQAGIFDGDRLIVDRGETPRDGRVVIAILDGELTIKRLRIGGDGSVTLAAENPGHPDIEVPALSDLQVWGVVMWSMHRITKS